MERLKQAEQRICEYCGVSFIAKPRTFGKYCSQSCHGKASSKPVVLNICEQCGKEYVVKKGCKGRFCSLVCAGKVQYQKVLKHNRGSWLGRKHTDEWKQMMSEKFKGRDATFTETIATRRKRSDSRKEWWKDKKRPEEESNKIHEIRNCFEMKTWRRNVLARDNYACKLCGKRGGKLHAHHIMKFIKYPDIRFEVSNGMTVCVECHRYLHKNKVSIIADIVQCEVIKNYTTVTAAHA